MYVRRLVSHSHFFSFVIRSPSSTSRIAPSVRHPLIRAPRPVTRLYSNRIGSRTRPLRPPLRRLASLPPSRGLTHRPPRPPPPSITTRAPPRRGRGQRSSEHLRATNATDVRRTDALNRNVLGAHTHTYTNTASPSFGACCFKHSHRTGRGEGGTRRSIQTAATCITTIHNIHHARADGFARAIFNPSLIHPIHQVTVASPT